MPRSITQYRVFIASPSGLDAERKAFRETLERYTARDAEPRGVTFHPVGWEDTIGGVGRPQDLIDEDLKQCDYAIFVLHDWWGSPTGSGHSSGVEEEWKLAEELYAATTIRNIGLFFKKVDERQLKDPGKQLDKVLEFKRQLPPLKSTSFAITRSPTSSANNCSDIWPSGCAITRARRPVRSWQSSRASLRFLQVNTSLRNPRLQGLIIGWTLRIGCANPSRRRSETILALYSVRNKLWPRPERKWSGRARGFYGALSSLA